jgi:hypothetical protein
MNRSEFLTKQTFNANTNQSDTDIKKYILKSKTRL